MCLQYLPKSQAELNPIVTNGLSHPYQMDEPIFILRGSGSDFSFLYHFSMKIMSANRIAPDVTPRFAILFCLRPIKRTPGLHGLKSCFQNIDAGKLISNLS